MVTTDMNKKITAALVAGVLIGAVITLFILVATGNTYNDGYENGQTDGYNEGSKSWACFLTKPVSDDTVETSHCHWGVCITRKPNEPQVEVSIQELPKFC